MPLEMVLEIVGRWTRDRRAGMVRVCQGVCVEEAVHLVANKVVPRRQVTVRCANLLWEDVRYSKLEVS